MVRKQGTIASKETRRQKVASRYRIVLLVGDNLNDVEMLEFAGIAVVMGNASEALKSRGYRLTGTNDEGGLAQAVTRYLKGTA